MPKTKTAKQQKPEPVTPTKGRPTTGAGKRKVQFPLSKDDLVARGGKLSHLMRQIEVEEENAKAAAATIKARIKDLKAQTKDLGTQLANGTEEREVDVLAEFDRNKGCKHLFIHAPGQDAHMQFVATETMTEDDYALLPLDVPAGKKPKKPEPQPAGGSGELPNPVIPPETKTQAAE